MRSSLIYISYTQWQKNPGIHGARWLGSKKIKRRLALKIAKQVTPSSSLHISTRSQVRLVLDFKSKFAKVFPVRTWESGICFQEHYFRIQTIQVQRLNQLKLSTPHLVTRFVYILIIYCTSTLCLDPVASVHTLATTSASSNSNWVKLSTMRVLDYSIVCIG